MAAEPEREDVEVSVSFYELYKVPGVKGEVRFYYPVVKGGAKKLWLSILERPRSWWEPVGAKSFPTT